MVGTKDPGGCLWLPLGLAAKVLVVSEIDYFRLSRRVQHAAASSETMNSSCGPHASRTSFGARLPSRQRVHREVHASMIFRHIYIHMRIWNHIIYIYIYIYICIAYIFKDCVYDC